MSIRICPICQTSFEAISRRRYCSRPCKLTANAEEAARYRAAQGDEINERRRARQARERRVAEGGMRLPAEWYEDDPDEGYDDPYDGVPREPDRRTPGQKEYDAAQERKRNPPPEPISQSRTVTFGTPQMPAPPRHSGRPGRSEGMVITNWAVEGFAPIVRAPSPQPQEGRFGSAVAMSAPVHSGQLESGAPHLEAREAEAIYYYRQADEHLRSMRPSFDR